MKQPVKPTKKKETTRVRSRNYCFTDYKLLDFGKLYELHKDIIRYMCWGEERCPKTKKIHYQGWIQMVNPKNFNVVHKLLGGKVHLERMKGTEVHNEAYCQKDKKFHVRGVFRSQGFRSDLEDIKKMLDSGNSMLSVATEHFSDYIRYYSGFGKYQELILKEGTKLFRKVMVIVHTGKTGTGKTRMAVASSPDDHYMIQGGNLKWWDGYNDEKTLIIDEYSNQIPITELLGILDGYQLRLPVKGGFTYANWETVYITTNLTTLHPNAKQEHIDALCRRVSEIRDF